MSRNKEATLIAIVWLLITGFLWWYFTKDIAVEQTTCPPTKQERVVNGDE